MNLKADFPDASDATPTAALKNEPAGESIKNLGITNLIASNYSNIRESELVNGLIDIAKQEDWWGQNRTRSLRQLLFLLQVWVAQPRPE